ncbi:MAG TPA: hypothetical protein VLF18_18305, partial [Tahibacter sp.]|uniref:hypothetical protein n=1 Tax=Tahibacter sp. TaxID=2056211 RepID=UPI002B53FC0E
ARRAEAGSASARNAAGVDADRRCSRHGETDRITGGRVSRVGAGRTADCRTAATEAGCTSDRRTGDTETGNAVDSSTRCA